MIEGMIVCPGTGALSLCQITQCGALGRDLTGRLLSIIISLGYGEDRSVSLSPS